MCPLTIKIQVKKSFILNVKNNWISKRPFYPIFLPILVLSNALHLLVAPPHTRATKQLSREASFHAIKY